MKKSYVLFIVCVLLSLLIACSCNKSIIGDVNCDGDVDSSDAMLIMQYWVGKDVDINLDVADINNDGVIDMADAEEILRIDANLSK